MSNLPDDWGNYYTRCECCGARYHLSEGGCDTCRDCDGCGKRTLEDELDEDGHCEACRGNCAECHREPCECDEPDDEPDPSSLAGMMTTSRMGHGEPAPVLCRMCGAADHDFACVSRGA